MARTNLKSVSVYLNEAQMKGLTKAAQLENRSVSNYLLNLGLERAVDLGVSIPGFRRAEVADAGKRRAVAGGR